MIKVLFLICPLIWRVNIYVSRQGKVKIGEKKVLLSLYKLSPLSVVLNIKLFALLTVVFVWRLFSLITRGDNHFHYKNYSSNSVSIADKTFPSVSW